MKPFIFCACAMLGFSLPAPVAQADVKVSILYDKVVTAEAVNPMVRDNTVYLPKGALPFGRINHRRPITIFPTPRQCEESTYRTITLPVTSRVLTVIVQAQEPGPL